MTTKKCSVDEKTPVGKAYCDKSPDKTHCWHSMPAGIIFVPGGTNTINEFCCWCGKNISYTVELSASFSVSTKEHGPYYKETII